VLVHYFSADGWEGWSLRVRPAIRDQMPVLIDDDLRFEDGSGPRPATVMNEWAGSPADHKAETRKSLSSNDLRTGTPKSTETTTALDTSHAGISDVADSVSHER